LETPYELDVNTIAHFYGKSSVGNRITVAKPPSCKIGSLIKALTYLGGVFKLRLAGQEKNDLIEYLKSKSARKRLDLQFPVPPTEFSSLQSNTTATARECSVLLPERRCNQPSC